MAMARCTGTGKGTPMTGAVEACRLRSSVVLSSTLQT